MKVSNEYLQFIMQKLDSLGYVTSRAMFGGYGIFHEGLMFALIADDTLYFKVNESNRAMYEKAGSKPSHTAYHTGKCRLSYWKRIAGYTNGQISP